MNIQIIILIISIILYSIVLVLMYKKIINQKHRIKYLQQEKDDYIDNQVYIIELEEKINNLEYNKKEMEKLYYQLLNTKELKKHICNKTE